MYDDVFNAASTRRLVQFSGLIGIAALLAGCPSVQTTSSANPTAALSGTPTPTTTTTTTTATTTATAATVGTAKLTWVAPTQNTDGSLINNLQGYHIHYGNSPTALGQMVDVSGASATTYVVTGLTTGTWYFSVSAYNSAGLESAPSSTASKTI